MLAAGIACGVIAVRAPDLARGSFPPLVWILAVSLMLDLVMMRLPGNKGLQTITMPWRVAGFIGAALLYLAVAQLAPSLP
ncbi:MAG: hypothetical protein A4S15_10360 [Candidatus Raskinella chloraquaticus]|uniref:Uncharacterized protein n=2 Tax=Candidatus Raskinella chloraquaticus TaxID=1951219 RepID=A0A1W9HVZ8_9HYPH|nr:MAG: hypothetical protein A4S15_10360 [Proteobacteria bacterium SG_bin8]